ncbi:MAG: histidine--tRNA ligase [Clostridia bacterium]|nr:histidine--tRNA ligase [Clostridia bacterium]
MEIENVKGGYDFLPEEQNIRNYINNTLKEVFEQYGYCSIETPILCYYDILAGKYDESNDLLNEIYKLTDQGKRKLGLRYDLTVPFSKLIALNKNKLTMPFKRYEIAKVFRDGPIKAGRDREFTQCDVDVVGIEGQMIEAELVSLYVESFKKLKIDVEIKYNSRKLMNGLILESGVAEDLTSKTITIIDKIEKLSKEDFEKALLEIGLTTEQSEKLQQYFSMTLEQINEMFKDTQNLVLEEGLKELNELNDYLTALNIQEYCKFTSSLARGQDYYTGTVFEVYEKNGVLNCSIGGGGRYDKIITDFINDGNVYPAVGVSFGLTSLYAILKDRAELSKKSQLDFYIIPMGTEKESLKLAIDLRKQGFNVDISMNGRKLKKCLDYANKANIPYVIILGEDEIEKGSFLIKDMNNKNQIEVSFDKIESVKDLTNMDNILQ